MTEEKMRFSAGDFEGPLELLWVLIRENKVSVFDIPINEITEQFLSWLDNAKKIELSNLSEFYRMAAKLVRIKTAEMLPQQNGAIEFDFEDEREELVESLIEYQRFKMLSVLMEKTEDENIWRFERKKIHRALPQKKDEWEKIDTTALLFEMRNLFKNMISSYTDVRILDMYEEISVGEKLTLLNEIFSRQNECRFSDLVNRPGNVLDIVCAFMAILDAVKSKIAVVYQNKLFGEIKICKFEI